MLSTIAILLSAVGAVYAQGAAYAQCGGVGFSGATTCVSGYVCTYNSEYYSQCLPGVAATTTPTPTTTGGSGSASTTYPGTTLQSGYYWIRAVESPNFHKYLQTSPEYVPGVAIMDDYTTAGQFQIVSGQLVELIEGGLLYANVVPSTNSSETKLAMTFNTTQNTYGTFDFSGDAVQWSVASITRPNLSAWLVCEDQQLYINLGNYDYLTPAGCADETIHYYNGATAVD